MKALAIAEFLFGVLCASLAGCSDDVSPRSSLTDGKAAPPSHRGPTTQTEAQAGFLDDFDDGKIDGWRIGSPWNNASVAPSMIRLDGGYAIRGKTWDPPTVNLTHSLGIDSVELTVEMRSFTGGRRDNAKTTVLKSLRETCYHFMDSGEGRSAEFVVMDGQGEKYRRRFPIADWSPRYRTFRWQRDREGWWSLAIDGVVVDRNFHKDATQTCFRTVHVHPGGADTLIDRVAVAGAASAGR